MGLDGVREHILEAVGRVVARGGAGKTTVDAIAREAGMSKGGVLHHFPSKDDMLVGIVTLYEERFLARRARLAAALPPTPYRLLKATVSIMVEDLRQTADTVPAFASVLHNAAARAEIGRLKRRNYEDLAAGVPDPTVVALALYAIDGLWMDIQFQPMAIPDATREQAIASLIKGIELADRDAAERCGSKAGTPGP